MFKPHFQKDIEDLRNSSKKKDIHTQESINKAIKAVLDGHWKGRGHLKGDYQGKRYRVAPNNYRLIYALCRECKALGHQKYNNCEDCKSISSKETVVFFTYLHRGNGY